MIAPASLKHQLLSLLIGAIGGHRPLRGMIAPASLKRGGQQRVHGREIGAKPLRGMIAPASLKRKETGGFRQPLAVSWGTTPGHDCPGLIEASG